jgi:hypothetical protein
MVDIIRALGLNPDDGKVARQPFSALKARLSAAPKGGADIDPYSPQILDQNVIGSCVPHGTLCAAATTLAAHGTPLPWVPSPATGYPIMLGLDRARRYPWTPSMKLPPLRDDGTMLLTGAEALSQWGVTAMGPRVKITFDGVEYEFESDCGPDNWDKLDLVTLEKASRKLIVGAYEVTSDFVTSACLALDAGYAVALANFVDVKHFMSYSGLSAPLGLQDFTDPQGGGHCTYLTSYKTDAAGKRLFGGRNSHGTQWGRFGRYEASEAFVNQSWSALIMDVEIA